METTVKHPVVIYAESTPNPSAMKFVADRILLRSNATAEYKNKTEAKSSPLANELFNFPFVKNVFISYNYISITKAESVSWEDITLEIRDFLKNYINSEKEIVTELPKQEIHTDNTFKETTTIFTEHTAPKTEIEHKIVEILEQYIRPAVENDGGLIVFKSFENGIVTVALKGSCSGCPSSTVTLKGGIEALLKRLIPEVKEVIAQEA